jgi:putative intracellular protease/amidase
MRNARAVVSKGKVIFSVCAKSLSLPPAHPHHHPHALPSAMGAAASIDLRPEEIDELTSQTKCASSSQLRLFFFALAD